MGIILNFFKFQLIVIQTIINLAFPVLFGFYSFSLFPISKDFLIVFHFLKCINANKFHICFLDTFETSVFLTHVQSCFL